MQKNTELGRPASRTFVRKMFFSVVWVMMLTAIISTVTVVIQGICIQRTMGTQEQCDDASAAEQLGLPIFALGTFFCYTFGFGLQILISRKINTTHKDEIAKYFSATMILNFCVILFFLLLGVFFSDFLATILGARGVKEHLHEYTSLSIKGFFVGFIFHSTFRVLHPAIYLDNARSYAYISTLAMAITTVLGFTLIGIYYPPCPEKMFWLGFFTSFPYAGGIIVFVIFFIVRRKTTMFRFSFKNLKPYHFGHLFVAGGATGLRKLSFALYLWLLNMIIVAVEGIEDGPGLTSSNIQMHYQTLLVIISSGIYYSGTVMSSYYTSLKDKQYFNEMLRFITIVCCSGVLVYGLIFVGLAGPLVKLYGVNPSSDPYVYKTSVYAIRWYALSLPFITFGGVWLSVYQGANNNKWLYVSIIWQDFFPLAIVAAFAFGFKTMDVDPTFPEWGIRGIFIGEFFGPVGVLIVHILVGWVVSKKNPFSAESIFFLESKKMYEEENIFRSSIKTKKQKELFSKNFQMFCESKNISVKDKNKILSLIDEIESVLLSSWNKKNNYSESIRVVKCKEQIILNFNDSIKSKIVNKEDSLYKQGIKALKQKYPTLLFNDAFNYNELTLNISSI